MKTQLPPVLRIVILAAGFSRRLSAPKALARVRAVSLLRRTARVLAPHANADLIVIAPPQHARYRVELRRLNAVIVANPHRSRGLSSSVRIGLARARYASAILFVPVDLAALRCRDVARLIAAWRAARRKLVARRIGPAGGTPLILPRRLFPVAARIEGDAGLRDVLRAARADERRFVPMPSAGLDVDTRADLARARRARAAAGAGARAADQFARRK